MLIVVRLLWTGGISPGCTVRHAGLCDFHASFWQSREQYKTERQPVHRFIGSPSWSCVRWHRAHEGFVRAVAEEDIVTDLVWQVCWWMVWSEHPSRCIGAQLVLARTRTSVNKVPETNSLGTTDRCRGYTICQKMFVHL